MARLPGVSRRKKSKKKAVGTAALLLGAAGLALYIVGVKRRHRLDDERVVGPDAGEPSAAARADDRDGREG